VTVGGGLRGDCGGQRVIVKGLWGDYGETMWGCGRTMEGLWED
jgi:hypothetical protein